MELWQAAFAWVPRLGDVTKSSEHGWLIAFWHYHLQLALSRLNAEPRDKDSHACFPYNTEQWLLERVAQVVLDLSQPAERAAFWQPILASAPHGARSMNSLPPRFSLRPVRTRREVRPLSKLGP